MSTYGQFCPVAKAMEVLDERWTLLVVRELLAGSTRFNELRRGVPKMSPLRGRASHHGSVSGRMPPTTVSLSCATPRAATGTKSPFVDITWSPKANRTFIGVEGLRL